MKYTQHGLERDTDAIGWFADKVCTEESFTYRNGGPWTLGDFSVVPVCGACGKWANRVQTCAKCREPFYQFFQHPRMGYHGYPHKPAGWYCWNCLEKWLPPAVQGFTASSKKIPPIPEILPPGYVIGVREERPNRFARNWM